MGLLIRSLTDGFRRFGAGSSPSVNYIELIEDMFDSIDGTFHVMKKEYMFQNSDGSGAVASDGDPVGKLLDLSGNGNHATQPTSASRPIYKTDGTLEWLQFNGTNQYIVGSSYSSALAQPNTAMIALTDNDTGGGSIVYSSANTTGNRNQLGYGSSDLILFAGLTFSSDATQSRPTKDTFYGLFDDSDSKIEINGADIPSSSRTNSKPNTSSTLGAVGAGIAPSENDTFGFVFINESLSAENKTTIYDYFDILMGN